MIRKLPIVAVLGQGSTLSAERTRLVRTAGAMIGRLGAHLLTGAGYGVMEAACEGFISVDGRLGLSIGIIPCDSAGPFDRPRRDDAGRAYPNPLVEIAVHTPLPPRTEDWHAVPSRNHVNIFTAHALLALPGNAGTRNELDMAAHYKGEAERPRAERRTVLLGPIEEFTPGHRELFVHAATVAETEGHLRLVLASQGFKLAPSDGEMALDARWVRGEAGL